MLQALLARASGGAHLLPYLPESMRPTSLPEAPTFTSLLSQDAWFQPIHFSWFAEPLQTFPAPTQPLFLSLLDAKKQGQVVRMLALEPASSKASPFMRPFLKDELKQKLQQGVAVVPEEHLPPSEMNRLIALKREQLLPLVDLLGVHDLATDLRQIVDKELLKKIHAALTPAQLTFLHYCSKQPMRWISPKLGLNVWDGSSDTLQRLLHGRGLARLGHALKGEDESLIWHLLHRLDIGRAAIVERVIRQDQDLALAPYFKAQVQHIATRYQT